MSDGVPWPRSVHGRGEENTLPLLGAGTRPRAEAVPAQGATLSRPRAGEGGGRGGGGPGNAAVGVWDKPVLRGGTLGAGRGAGATPAFEGREGFSPGRAGAGLRARAAARRGLARRGLTAPVRGRRGRRLGRWGLAAVAVTDSSGPRPRRGSRRVTVPRSRSPGRSGAAAGGWTRTGACRTGPAPAPLRRLRTRALTHAHAAGAAPDPAGGARQREAAAPGHLPGRWQREGRPRRPLFPSPPSALWVSPSRVNGCTGSARSWAAQGEASSFLPGSRSETPPPRWSCRPEWGRRAGALQRRERAAAPAPARAGGAARRAAAPMGGPPAATNLRLARCAAARATAAATPAGPARSARSASRAPSRWGERGGRARTGRPLSHAPPHSPLPTAPGGGGRHGGGGGDWAGRRRGAISTRDRARHRLPGSRRRSPGCPAAGQTTVECCCRGRAGVPWQSCPPSGGRRPGRSVGGQMGAAILGCATGQLWQAIPSRRRALENSEICYDWLAHHTASCHHARCFSPQGL